MNGNVENLILVQMRERLAETAAMRSDMTIMKKDVSALRVELNDGFDPVNARVDGVATLLTLRAGHVHHIDELVGKPEGSLAR